MKMIRKSAITINKDIGWEEDIILSTNDKSFSLTLKGIHTLHHLSYDTEGQRVNSSNAHVLICEKDLIDSQYPYRNDTTNIHLLEHRVTVNTDFGTKEFIVDENYPSETFGMIVLILRNINTNKRFNGTNQRKYTNPKL